MSSDPATFAKDIIDQPAKMQFEAGARSGGAASCGAFWASAVPAFGLQPEGTEKVWGDGFEIETLLSLRTPSSTNGTTANAQAPPPDGPNR
jgi:hypothetical protein